jgi:aldehyde dehydrogenase
MDADDEFFDKCLEGATLFALTRARFAPARRACSSRNRSPRSSSRDFVERTKQIKMGHPLDPTTMMGAQASKDQYEKILNYLQIAKDEGAEVLTGGNAYKNPDLRGRLLHRADDRERPQQDARLSGRDLRTGHGV